MVMIDFVKVYGIPSSTLYKIARKEKIELAQPFNAVQTTWTQGWILESALAVEFGLKSGNGTNTRKFLNMMIRFLFACEPTQNVFACSGRSGVFPGRHPQGDAGAKGGLRVRNPLGDALRAVQEGNRKIIQKLKSCNTVSPLQVGIELSKTAAVHWSDDDMKKALESVRSGGMSINQVRPFLPESLPHDILELLHIEKLHFRP